MRFISPNAHAVLDYLAGLFLILFPVIFQIKDGTMAQYLPIVLGIVTILLALLTNYKGGAAKIISFRTHLRLDVAQALLLALSPWIFGFADRVYLPHLLTAIAELLVVICSQKPPLPVKHMPDPL